MRNLDFLFNNPLVEYIALAYDTELKNPLIAGDLISELLQEIDKEAAVHAVGSLKGSLSNLKQAKEAEAEVEDKEHKVIVK